MWDDVIDQSGHSQAHLEYNFLEQTEVEKIASISGWSISTDYVFAIDAEDLQHIHNRHGAGNEKDPSQREIDKQDILKVPDILENYDLLVFDPTSTMGPTIIYQKLYYDTTYLIVVHRSKRQELHIKSMRIKK